MRGQFDLKAFIRAPINWKSNLLGKFRSGCISMVALATSKPLLAPPASIVCNISALRHARYEFGTVT